MGLPEEIHAISASDQIILLDDPLKKYMKLYPILIVIGAVCFIMMGGLIGLMFGIVIGWAAAYITMQFISAINVFKLNFKDHSLPKLITDDQLYNYFSKSFNHPEFSVEKGILGVSLVYKNTTSHRIRIDRDKNVYSIVSKLTNKNMIKKRHNPAVTEYRNAFAVTPMIQKAVEDAAKASV